MNFIFIWYLNIIVYLQSEFVPVTPVKILPWDVPILVPIPFNCSLSLRRTKSMSFLRTNGDPVFSLSLSSGVQGLSSKNTGSSIVRTVPSWVLLLVRPDQEMDESKEDDTKDTSFSYYLMSHFNRRNLSGIFNR